MKVWNDNRSGVLGQSIGNRVLNEVSKKEGPAVHRKGTVFSIGDKIYIGRVCASDKYLQKGIVHFCNISPDQHAEFNESDLHYLFITLMGKTAHYWKVPAKIIKSEMNNLSPKNETETCFLRICEQDGKYKIGKTNISKYHNSIDFKTNMHPRRRMIKIRKMA